MLRSRGQRVHCATDAVIAVAGCSYIGLAVFVTVLGMILELHYATKHSYLERSATVSIESSDTGNTPPA